MNKKKNIIFALSLAISASLCAMNPAESVYEYAVTSPDHAPKSAVTGWTKQRVEEKLNRGLKAIRTDDGKVYLSWRLLKSDAPQTVFNVYRSDSRLSKPQKQNSKPISLTTDFIDEHPVANAIYAVVPVLKGKPLAASEPVSVSEKNYTSIKLKGDYQANRMATADLNGDGVYDYVILQPSYGIDPGFKPDTTGTTYKLEAYLSDGTFLWQIDLGLGIEPGTWYSPFVVYDFNGDGKAEVVAKTAPNQRNANGRVTEGAEWVSIFDGMTGKEIAREDWPARSPRFGDYNRNNRNQMGVAYLDGKTPSLLVARGTYRLMVVDAYQLNGTKLEKLWRWDGDEENPVIRSQGAHSMISADVDSDGRDEVLLGSAMLDDNGTLLWSAGLGHPDKIYVTDIDPKRPGMEAFFAIEAPHKDGKGVSMYDAKTGEFLWGIGKETLHVGDGMVADIDPSRPGLECFASEDPKGGSTDKYMFSADGKRFGSKEEVPGCRNWIFWDADKLRETFRGDGYASERSPSLSIVKYKGDTLSNNIQGKIMMIGDYNGDWREELITALPGELRIYSTVIPAKDRRVCLMQDPIYRGMVAHRSMGYLQTPVTGYYLGE